MKNLEPDRVATLVASLSLPAAVEIGDYLGTGGRAHVFAGMLDGQPIIAKVYRDDAVEKYRRRFGVDIAEFEFERNRALHAIDEIRRHIAIPYRVYTAGGEFAHCMLQEYVGGRTLKELITERGHLPDAILEAGYKVVRAAAARGIHDLDMAWKNVRVVDVDGEPVLKLYDFNLMPQHLAPPNPLLGLALKLGLRSKSYRDYRNLEKWQQHGKRAKSGASP